MSLYSYEAQAIKKIKDDVKKYQLGEVVANFNLYNEHAQRYFEIDLLVFTNWLIYLVELKHWNGRIVIQPYEWLITNASGHKEVRKDPHILNSNKARMFAGKLRNQFPHFPRLFVSSTLLLTHPKADVIGTTNFDNKIEFDTITIHKVENFISHLRKKKKFNQKIYHSRLSKEQLNTVYSYFENINLSKNSKHLSILPNIKILKEIGVFDDYVEYLAKDTLASKHLFRLRVFYSSIFVEKPELMQKALATKKAFGKVKDHTNLLQVDLFLTDNEDIVEKSLWSDRGTLRNVINNHAPLSEEESLTIIEGILNGLKVIHELPICHRNIAPENILMVGKTPKLMNFDLCYQPIDDRVTVIPNPEQLLVSAYMPPELYQGETDQKGDLFSVGAILYELLTGKKLFESTRSYKARGTIDQEAVDYINDLEPKVSKNTIDTVFKLVQLEPSLRPNSAEEVLKTLCRKSYNIKKMFNKKLEMGTNIGMCYNIDFIAEGSEAQLYEGLGPNGVRWVLKVFNHEVELDRIMRERDIVSSINRQHILKYVSFGEIIDDKRKYIIFEKVRGKNLRQHIQENETPDLENFKKVAFDLLRAIDYIHEEIEEENKPIYVHNDIKPENIILDENLNATLIDFGLATEGECICMHSGTEGYIAPDMVSGIDRNCNISGDIFSLGVTLFEWFFGKSPYETVSLKEKPIDFKNLRTNISDVFFDWWIKAINFRAENRFSNAKEMRFELQKALDQKKSFDEAKKNPKEDVEISLKKGPEEKSKNITTANSCKTCNQFVSYLNSMIVFNPDAENSLAESQACSEQFKNIYVEHPLISKVYNLFQNKKEIFILTGHAGDGKSTVCIEFYKKLKKIKPGHPISIPIKRREEFNVNGKKLVMIKDFSEWSGNKK
jgi:serine/threonine protein kinase